MRPESVGLGKSMLVMGKLSGRHAFRQRLEELGFKPTEEELNRAFERFKRLADQKKEIYEEDLEAIISEELQTIPETYRLKSLYVESGTDKTPTARIKQEIDGKVRRHTGTVEGPWDATYPTIAALTNTY